MKLRVQMEILHLDLQYIQLLLDKLEKIDKKRVKALKEDIKWGLKK